MLAVASRGGVSEHRGNWSVKLDSSDSAVMDAGPLASVGESVGSAIEGETVCAALARYESTLRDTVREIHVDVSAFKLGVERRLEETLHVSGPLGHAVAQLQQENRQLRSQLETLTRQVEMLTGSMCDRSALLGPGNPQHQQTGGGSSGGTGQPQMPGAGSGSSQSPPAPSSPCVGATGSASGLASSPTTVRFSSRATFAVSSKTNVSTTERHCDECQERVRV